MLPFAGGVSATANGLLVLSVIAALTYGVMLEMPRTWRRTVAKTAAVALLAVVAFERGGPWLLVAALVLSALGDAFLAHDGEKPFIGGLASFLVAHVAYVWLFITHEPRILPEHSVVFLMPVTLGLAGFAGFMAWRLMPAVDAKLRAPVLAYIAAILAMGISAAWFQPPVILLGAIIFMASDSALASGKFLLDADHRRQRHVALFVWASYYIAQLVIMIAWLT